MAENPVVKALFGRAVIPLLVDVLRAKLGFLASLAVAVNSIDIVFSGGD